MGAIETVGAHPPNSFMAASAVGTVLVPVGPVDPGFGPGEAAIELSGHESELAVDVCLMVEGCGMLCTSSLGCQARGRFRRAQAQGYEFDISISLGRADDERLPIRSPEGDAVALL